MRLDLIVGARPNFVKVAPVERALRALGSRCAVRLVHSGQHYDATMSDVFFTDLKIPEPDVFLGVGPGEHGAQTGAVMARYEEALLRDRPDVVLVFGDVNSTMACALTAVKQGVRVGHVEAGLRSFDRTMPEEINRIVTDHVCDFLFTPSPDADANLAHEGIPAAKIHRVGNVMIDALVGAMPRIEASTIVGELGLAAAGFGVVTLHRPSNVDGEHSMHRVLDALEDLQSRVPLVFPVHPRTRKRFEENGTQERLARLDGLRLLDPLSYCDFLSLVRSAAFVLTDSGGIQEETTFLGIPCVTARTTTERPITVDEGTNVVVGNEASAIVRAVHGILDGGGKRGRVPALWDGHAAERIAEILEREFLAA